MSDRDFSNVHLCSCLYNVSKCFSDGNNQNYKLQVCPEKQSDVIKCPECDAIPRAKPGEWSIAKCGIVGQRVLLTKATKTEFELIEIDILGYCKYEQVPKGQY